MKAPSARELAVNPEWIPHAIEESGECLTSVYVPVASRKDLVFLTDGQLRGAYPKASALLDSVRAEAQAALEAPLHFIFHSSFCCSTLLAKALERPGTSTSLSEPNILVNLAEQAERGAIAAEGMLDLALRLLARPAQAGETVIVKPSSFANRLIGPVLDLRARSRGILLYSSARTFLSSVVRRGLLGRINARRLYRSLISGSTLDFGFSAAETFEQTDLQIAALAWLMQIALFDELSGRYGQDRLLLLDAADLLADPAGELERVQSFFGLGFTGEQIGGIVDGPVFSRHSKNSAQDYDPKVRERDLEALVEVHSDELGMVLQWLEAVAGHMNVPLRPRLQGRAGALAR
ncbi:hypothetical protein [Sphingomonas agri]|uniref:hypothetical protein n=1 Tax=Sphingomonas agri TaxID=1813878 RepID=UPI00311F324E